MNYTSIDQSKKLRELGLSPATADMMWCMNDGGKYIIHNIVTGAYQKDLFSDRFGYTYPCWSVGALLELIPIQAHLGYSLVLEQSYMAFDDCARNIHEDIDGETILDVCFNTVVWLLENGYIKKEE